MTHALAPSGPSRPFDVLWAQFGTSQSLSPAHHAELQALLKEKDVELLSQGLSSLASRLERAGQVEAAASLYRAISEALPQDADPALRRRVESRLAGIEGRAEVGVRVDFLLNRFAKDAFDPKVIAPMMLGTSVYSLTRTLALSRLGTSGLFRAVGPRLAASSLGFASEVPAFALSARALRPASGHEPSIGQELAAAAITLGFLKSFGHGAQALGATPALRHGSRFQQQVLSQTAMFGGLMVAHKFEERLGLRPHVDGATTVTDTLASMLSLGIGASLAHRALGPRYAAIQNEMNWRFKAYSNEAKLEIKSPFIPEPLMMAAGAGGGAGGSGRDGNITVRHSKSKKLGREVLIDRILQISRGKLDRQEAASLLDTAADGWIKKLGPWSQMVFRERVLAENPTPRQAFQARLGWTSWPQHVRENRILKNFTDQALRPAVAELLRGRGERREMEQQPAGREILGMDLPEFVHIPELEINKIHDLLAQEKKKRFSFLSTSREMDLPLGKLNLLEEVESALLKGGVSTVGMLSSATRLDLLRVTTLNWQEIRDLENRLKALGLGFSLDRSQGAIPDVPLARFPLSEETMSLFQKANISNLRQLKGADSNYVLINAHKFLTTEGVTLPDIWRAQDEIVGLGFSCFVIFPDSIEVDRLPAAKLVHPKAQKKLARDGIETLGDLLKLPRAQIARRKYFPPADLKRLFQAVEKLED